MTMFLPHIISSLHVIAFQVVASESLESFLSSVEDLADVIDIAGCGSLLRLDRKIQLVDTVKKFIVIDRVRPAAEQ